MNIFVLETVASSFPLMAHTGLIMVTVIVTAMWFSVSLDITGIPDNANVLAFFDEIAGFLIIHYGHDEILDFLPMFRDGDASQVLNDRALCISQILYLYL